MDRDFFEVLCLLDYVYVIGTSALDHFRKTKGLKYRFSFRSVSLAVEIDDRDKIIEVITKKYPQIKIKVMDKWKTYIYNDHFSINLFIFDETLEEIVNKNIPSQLSIVYNSFLGFDFLNVYKNIVDKTKCLKEILQLEKDDFFFLSSPYLLSLQETTDFLIVLSLEQHYKGFSLEKYSDQKLYREKLLTENGRKAKLIYEDKKNKDVSREII